jgi:hypothetical protein
VEQLGGAVVAALAKLTQGSEDNARGLCDARGVGPLLRVLLSPSSGPGTPMATRKAAAQALRALTQLLYTDGQRKAVQEVERALAACCPTECHLVWTRIARRARAQLRALDGVV